MAFDFGMGFLFFCVLFMIFAVTMDILFNEHDTEEDDDESKRD